MFDLKNTITILFLFTFAQNALATLTFPKSTASAGYDIVTELPVEQQTLKTRKQQREVSALYIDEERQQKRQLIC